MSAESSVSSGPPSPLCHDLAAENWKTAHAQLQADDALWRSLSFDGVQHDGMGGLLEHRRCPRCGSTMARPITPEQALMVSHHQAALHARTLEAIADAAVRRAAGQPTLD